MFTLFLAVLSIYGFLASVIIHILSFFNLNDLISSLFLFLGSMVIGIPGIFIYPSSLPPYNRGFQANYNFWRLIPKKWITALGLVSLYCIGQGVITVFLFSNNNSLPVPYISRFVSGFAIILFFYHSLGYWYHAPLEARKILISALHPKKKRHRKHD